MGRAETVRFLRRMFASYYERARLSMPRDFWMREFGFMGFDGMMNRHRAFKSAAQMRNFLRLNAPAHVFFSSAIYERPSAYDMADKGWKGADLIFDIDADHIIGDRSTSYEKMLERVKAETAKLIDFLVADFGIDERDIELVFSGSRGYHIHVPLDEVRALRSRERREIVDYLRASGLEREILFNAADVAAESATGGWRARILKRLLAFFREIRDMSEEDAIERLCRIKGIGEKRARKLIAFAAEIDDAAERRIVKALSDRRMSIAPGLEQIVQDLAVSLGSEADAPVTSDIHRLIRMPTSLHGKTGLVVKPLSLREFDDFEPLEDAIAFSTASVRVRALKKSAVRMRGEEYAIDEGEEAEIPEFAAVYFMCRGVAEI